MNAFKIVFFVFKIAHCGKSIIYISDYIYQIVIVSAVLTANNDLRQQFDAPFDSTIFFYVKLTSHL
jgi:hypothetical protein